MQIVVCRDFDRRDCIGSANRGVIPIINANKLKPNFTITQYKGGERNETKAKDKPV